MSNTLDKILCEPPTGSVQKLEVQGRKDSISKPNLKGIQIPDRLKLAHCRYRTGSGNRIEINHSHPLISAENYKLQQRMMQVPSVHNSVPLILKQKLHFLNLEAKIIDCVSSVCPVLIFWKNKQNNMAIHLKCKVQICRTKEICFMIRTGN